MGEQPIKMRKGFFSDMWDFDEMVVGLHRDYGLEAEGYDALVQCSFHAKKPPRPSLSLYLSPEEAYVLGEALMGAGDKPAVPVVEVENVGGIDRG